MDYETPIEIIKKVGALLAQEIPTEKPALIKHLTKLEALRFDLAHEVAEHHKIYAEQRRRMLHPKDKEFTELDRNVMLDAHVSAVRKDYEFLSELQEIVRDRIELSKTILTFI